MRVSKFGQNRRTLVANGTEPLTLDAIVSVAPSVVADGAHESRSARYTFISTLEVLRALLAQGWQVFSVVQAMSRIAGKMPFTKHMLRMRHPELRMARHGDVTPETILVNSHDGTSSYTFLLGLIRWMCMNGCISGDFDTEQKVAHKGDVLDSVRSAAFNTVGMVQGVSDRLDVMKGVTLSRYEQLVLARAALALRFDARLDDGIEQQIWTPTALLDVPAPITAEQLLEPRRAEDIGDSAWLAYQRIQENGTKGGQQGRSASGRRMTTRAVQGIDSNVRFNRLLEQVAFTIAAQKVSERMGQTAEARSVIERVG